MGLSLIVDILFNCNVLRVLKDRAFKDVYLEYIDCIDYSHKFIFFCVAKFLFQANSLP